VTPEPGARVPYYFQHASAAPQQIGGAMPYILPEVPAEFDGDRIIRLPLAAALSGYAYETVLDWAKAGKFGPLYRLGTREYGLKLRNFRQAIEDSAVETDKRAARRQQSNIAAPTMEHRAV
jgi:hypothetical protein